MAKNGRPTEPLRDLKIYLCVEDARKMKRPKHPGLEPVQLSWDKAYEVAQWALERDWNITLSTGAIRAAYRHGKKLNDWAQQQIKHNDAKLKKSPRPR
jgi:hypothetical protein